MQYSAEFIILAPPFERNFQITWQKITSWEKWILRIKPRWLPFILDSPTSAPRGQRLLLQPVQKTGTNQRVPILLILDILWFYQFLLPCQFLLSSDSAHAHDDTIDLRCSIGVKYILYPWKLQ